MCWVAPDSPYRTIPGCGGNQVQLALGHTVISPMWPEWGIYWVTPGFLAIKPWLGLE